MVNARWKHLFVSPLVVERDRRSMFTSHLPVPLDQLQAIVDDRQRRQPKKVHLEQSPSFRLPSCHRQSRLLRSLSAPAAPVPSVAAAQSPRRRHAHRLRAPGLQAALPVSMSERTLGSFVIRNLQLLRFGQCLLDRDADRRRNQSWRSDRLRHKGISSARPTSLIAAFAAIVLNVMICATCSRPYLRCTYSITSPRRFMQKSISISGI